MNPELKRAVDYLAGRCDFAFRRDSQGFNAYDTQFGHALADLQAWSPKQARAAWEMIRKYRGQLAEIGIDYDAIPGPPDQNGNGRTIDADRDLFIIRFPYDKDLVNVIRELPGRRWNAQMKFNTAPATELSTEWLKSFASKYNFAFTDKALALIDKSPTESKADAIKAIVNNGKIVVSMPYKCQNFYEALAAIKSTPGRKWDDNKKVWTVPLNEATNLLSALGQLDNFTPSKELVKLAQEQKQIKQELSKAATAQSSEFEVTGLGGTLYPFQKAGVEYALRAMGFDIFPNPHYNGAREKGGDSNAKRCISPDATTIRSCQTEPGKRAGGPCTGKSSNHAEGTCSERGVETNGLRANKNSNVETRNKGKTLEGPGAGQRKLWGEFQGGEWTRTSRDSIETKAQTGDDGLYYGIGYPNKRTQHEPQPSIELQGGFRASNNENSNRTGWNIPPLQEATEIRPEEGRGAECSWLVSTPPKILGGVLIADAPGLGKTIQALTIIEFLGAFPAIVVCPASVKLNWSREIHKWLPHRLVEVWAGRNGNKNDHKQVEIIVLNFDILKDRLDELKSLSPKSVILDEATAIKNYKAQRTKAAKELGKGVLIKLCLTGTPILNRPQELLSPLAFLDRLNDFGGFWEFARRYCDLHRNHWGWDFSGASNLNELHEKLKESCFVRRCKSEVIKELPAKQRTIIPIPIDNEKEYQEAETNLIAWVGRQAIQNKHFLASIAELNEDNQRLAKKTRAQDAQQRAERAEQLVKIEALKQLAVRGKLVAIKEWITNFLETGEKLVIFAHHREVVEALSNEFDAARILGGDAVESRQKAIDTFQNDPNTNLIVCSTLAAGLGITLTAASNAAIIELEWSPAQMDQAEDRLHRIGQDESVNIWYLLAAGTIEEKIAALIDKKRTVVDAATDGIETEVEQGILAALMKALQEEQ